MTQEFTRLIKPMPHEWENPISNFQPVTVQRMMFHFDRKQDTGVFDRHAAWTQDPAFKAGIFREFCEYLNPASGEPQVQGVRIQEASMEQITLFFNLVHVNARNRVACLWVDTIVSLDMIKDLLSLFPSVTTVRFEPVPLLTHPDAPKHPIHRVHPLVRMWVQLF